MLVLINYTLRNGTLHERVAGHPGRTSAHGYVIVHGTQRVSAAGAWTRVHAPVAYTRTIVGAIGIRDALGTAAHVGITLVLREARASAVVASCIRPTGIQVTGIGKRGRRYKRADSQVNIGGKSC